MSDVRRIVDALLVLQEVSDVPSLQAVALPLIGRLVGCDVGVLTTYDAREPAETAVPWPRGQFGPADFEGYAELLPTHPFVEHLPTVTAAPALRISDVTSLRSWRSSGLYREHHRHLGADDQLVAAVAAGPVPTALVMSRSGSGFRDRDRDVLGVIAPHLARMVRRSLAAAVPYEALHVGPRPVLVTRGGPHPDPAPTLTAREEEVVSLVAAGWTSARIGRSLGISPRTVEKHLQNVHAKLGAASSVEAVVRWSRHRAPAAPLTPGRR